MLLDERSRWPDDTGDSRCHFQYNLHDRAKELATFGVGDVGGKAKFLVCLNEEILGALRVTAKLTVVIGLGGVDRLVGGDDGLLSAPQIAVIVADVDGGGLGEGKYGSSEDEGG
jgi:hypothetical protein